MSKIKDVVQTMMRTNFKFDTDVKILIVSDVSSEKLGNDFHQSLHELGWSSSIAVMEDRNKSGEEPDDVILEEMKQNEIVFCITKYSMTHTKARKEANNRGVSVITMPGITEDMFLNGAINANYEIVEKETLETAEKITAAKEIEIKTGEGYKLTIPIGDRKGIASTGVFVNKGDSGNLPSGEAFVAPQEYQANGEILINGSISGIGLLKEPVLLTIEGGRITSASGEEGKELLDILNGGDGTTLAELGIGTNYSARVTGKILEDEKANDTIHVAFGSNHTFGGVIDANVHIDCVTISPEIVWLR